MGRTAPVWIMCLTSACGAPQGVASDGSGASRDAAAASSAAEPSPPTPLETIARFTTGKQVKAGEILHKLGYVSPMGESAWSGLPVMRQIEIAYLSAEAADPDRGGQFFLAAFARELTASTEVLKNDPSLVRYLKLATLLGPIRFKPPAGAQTQAPLPDDVRHTIKLLSEYGSRSLLGSQHHILVKYFNVPSDAAFALFTGGQSYAQVLEQALAKVDAARQDEVVRTVAAAVATHYEAARREPSLTPLLASWSPPAASAAPETYPELATVETNPAPAGILRVENPGPIAFDLYLNRKLLGRIGTGMTASFSVAPGIHGFEWRETEVNSPFSDPQPLNVTAGNIHTLKAPRIVIEAVPVPGATAPH